MIDVLLAFINESWDVNVLLVDVTKFEKFPAFVFMNPSCVVKVELIFNTELFNVVILLFTELFKAVCATSVAFIELTDEVLLLIEVNWDANVLFVDVTKLAIFEALVLIEVRCEVNVLLVDDVRTVILLVFAFMRLSCDVRDVFVLEIIVFNAFCVADDVGLFKSEVLSKYLF